MAGGPIAPVKVRGYHRINEAGKYVKRGVRLGQEAEMVKPVIGGNWKMTKLSVLEQRSLAAGITIDVIERIKTLDVITKLDGFKEIKDVEVIIAPPFTSMGEVKAVMRNHSAPVNMFLAAQNMHEAADGAYTGEVSARHLLDAEVEYVILGHSERRAIFGESNELVNAKVLRALDVGLKVIFCCGETLEQREADKAFAVIQAQIEMGLRDVSREDIEKVIIAYEPVWAIGTGKTATPEEANGIQAQIRDLIAKLYDQEIANRIRIQYGGSVKPDNIDELMAMPNIDGALVGGASQKFMPFSRIIAFKPPKIDV